MDGPRKEAESNIEKGRTEVCEGDGMEWSQ